MSASGATSQGQPGGGNQTGTSNDPTLWPRSPWAERFDYPDVPFNFGDGLLHSGHAPEYPSLDALNYHDLPSQQPINKPDDQGLDRLFHTEKWQDQRLLGLKSWQVGAINLWTVASNLERHSEYMASANYHGGHSANYDHGQNYIAYERGLFTVDESRWFNFLKKENWLELEQKSFPNETRRRIQHWTVNNDRIWYEVKIIVEFAYRVMDQLIKERDQWLDTLLFGEMVNLDGSPIPASVTTEPEKYALQARPRPSLPDRGKYEAIARARVEELTRFVTFSFTDEWDEEQADANARGESMAFYERFRRAEPGYRMTPLVLTNASFIRDLCEDAPPILTPAEASLKRYDTSKTLLHEIMHSIAFQRCFDRWAMPSTDELEPYIGDEQLAEVGISFDRHFLGGAAAHGGDLGSTTLMPGRTYREKLQVWLHSDENVVRSYGAYNQAPRDALDLASVRKRYPINLLWLVPPFFASLLFTDQYWNDVVAKKGRNAFKPPAVCYTPTYRGSNGVVAIHGAHLSDKKPAVDELRGPLQTVRAAWQDRNTQMAQLRPWFDAARAQWQMTLWGWSGMRTQIQLFRIHHAQRDLRGCLGALRVLTRNSLDFIQNASDPIYNKERLTYIPYRIVCYLMAASLPFRDLPEEISEVNQLDYLATAMALLFPLSTLATPVSKPWRDALVSCYRHLYQQRMVPFMNFRTDWADFIFDVPAYDSNAPDVLAHLAAPNVSLAGPSLTADVVVPPNSFPKEGVGRSPKIPAQEPGPKTPTRFYTASEIAGNDYIIVPTSNIEPEVWDPSGIANGVWGSTPAAQNMVLDQWHCGKVLKNDSDPAAQAFRRELRSQPDRRMGKLLVWYTESEVLEFDGVLSRTLFKMWGQSVYNITEFLEVATEDEAKAVLSPDPQSAGYLDETKISDALWNKLGAYICGGVRPDSVPPITTMANSSPLLLTLSQLRAHDNPDSGVYIAIDGFIYDITDYIQHHPTHFALLARLAGQDVTQEFYQAHPRGIASLNIAVVGHTIQWVGRVLPEWDGRTIRADEFVLHDFVYKVDATRQSSYGGRDMTRSLVGQGSSPEKLDLTEVNLRRPERAVAKRVPVDSPSSFSITPAELRAHNDAFGLEGAWVAPAATLTFPPGNTPTRPPLPLFAFFVLFPATCDSIQKRTGPELRYGWGCVYRIKSKEFLYHDR
ncbi:hypothetical protein PG993_011347 [Apiospora rasikravindrae]|uniref:Cytochrome b5 heme-binding domain-containing protein n=1 Tax=Apiospora rasikravindrae TaxID=990691 RepID=A0ABR1SDX8_9PEZI